MSETGQGPKLAGFRSIALAVAWRSVHNFTSNLAFFLPAVIFPLFFFAAFAGGLSAVGNVPGYALAAFVRALVTWTILTAIALVAGMEVGGEGVELVGLYGLAVLVNLAATMWAAGVAMRVRSIQGGPLMQFPVFLILFLAPVYVPLSLLSGWIHAVASINPVTALLEAGRGFISGEPVVVALALAIAVTLPVLFGLWARGGLRRAEAAG